MISCWVLKQLPGRGITIFICYTSGWSLGHDSTICSLCCILDDHCIEDSKSSRAEELENISANMCRKASHERCEIWSNHFCESTMSSAALNAFLLSHRVSTNSRWVQRQSKMFHILFAFWGALCKDWSINLRWNWHNNWPETMSRAWFTPVVSIGWKLTQ